MRTRTKLILVGVAAATVGLGALAGASLAESRDSQQTAPPARATTVPVVSPPRLSATTVPIAPVATTAPLATSTPIAVASPTPLPSPTQLPAPTPLTAALSDLRYPRLRGDWVAIPVLGSTVFELSHDVEIIQHPGHALLYLPDLGTEIDLFVPLVTPDREPIEGMEAVMRLIDVSPAWQTVSEFQRSQVNGARVIEYRGVLEPGVRHFFTDADHLTNPSGWISPSQLVLWIIETPNGLLALTAESADAANIAEFNETVLIAQHILESIVFLAA